MLLNEVDPLEVVPWRVISAVIFCVIVVTIMRAWAPVRALFTSPKRLAWFGLSAVLLYANWQIFVIGVLSGKIIETSLGYFINPLVTILIGVLVRKEKLRVAQWAAVVIAAVGVTISTIAYGEIPYIALGVALTFGLYGAVRKQVSEDIDALTGLTVETLLALVIALPQLAVVMLFFGGSTAFSFGSGVTVALLLSGTVTAIPLMLFAAGTRRLPLSHMGFIQFMTPILGFITGYFIFGEEMPLARWIGFITVWVALIVLIVDMLSAASAAEQRSKRQVAPTIHLE